MSRDKTEKFHGTLAYHPACLPIIPVNWASKTALKTVLEGDPKVVDEVAEEIAKRKKRFHDADELANYFLEIKRLKVTVDAQFAEFSSY